MKISVIHPSRGRPVQAVKTIHNWLSKSNDWHNIDYTLVLDNDDKSMYDTEELFLNYAEFRTHRNEHSNCIQAINRVAKLATGDILIVVSDDFDCPEHWDTLLLEALKGKEDFCVKTKDGYQPTLMTLPILDRKYYNRFGYIYNPIYEHNYADQEMTAVAMMLCRDINIDIEFTHNHWLKAKRVKDDLDSRNWRTIQTGKPIYNQRVKENFGIANPVIPYSQIRWR